jgi:peptide/nickel transport system substrate-binding protein
MTYKRFFGLFVLAALIVALVPATGLAAQPPQQEAGMGGVPVIILDGEPNDLSPITGQSRVTYTVLDEVNCFLARYDEDLNIIPSAATSWDFVDDKTVKFNLQSGIKFHNGEEMTADDVKFSIEAHLDPAQGSGIRAMLAAVDKVEVVDKTTAVVHLKEPYAPLIDVLIDRVPILPRSVYDTPGAARDEPVGCGPFKFKEWRKNSYILLDKNPDYWVAGLPKADGLKYVFLADYNAAKASLLSKESDVLLMLNLVDIPAMSQEPGIVIDAVPLMGFWWIGMNMEREPFTDQRVREAVKLAIERQQFVDSVLAGHGAPAIVPVPKTSPFYPPEVEYAQDVAKAKQLLADAGYADGLTFALTVPKTAEEEPMGVVLQSQLAAIGVTAELEVLEVPAFIERIFTNRDFAMHICGDTAGPDPASLLNRYYMSTSPTNIHNYKNPKVDEALTKAAATFDMAERKKYYAEALQMVVADSPMVWIARGERVSAYWDYLEGFVNLPTLRYEFWNLHFVKEK